MATYPDVELDRAPEDKEGRIPISICHSMDLREAQNRADGGKQAQQEQTDNPCFLSGFDVQLQQQRNGQADDHNVADDREDGQPIKGRSCRETGPRDCHVPGAVNLCHVRFLFGGGAQGGLTGWQSKIKTKVPARWPKVLMAITT